VAERRDLTPLAELTAIARELPVHRLGVLAQAAQALQREIQVEVGEGSDIASDAFVEDFSGRLLVYHAFHEQKLTKKTFEFVFRGASRAAGRSADITASAVNPGADVKVDGVAYSLKTEGAKSMTKKAIVVSKFMEARWIRECRTGADFAREVRDRVVEHLGKYERILTLRAFETQRAFEYSLVEIPLSLLERVGELEADDFTPRTKSGGSSAKVRVGGQPAFTLRLDGSVEKVTLGSLQTRLCTHHATWKVER
jgi:hypothetical protein